MSTKKIILAGLAAAAVCTFTAQDAKAQVSGSFTYACNDAVYGTSGSFWNSANVYMAGADAGTASGTVGAGMGVFFFPSTQYISAFETYNPSCGVGDTRNASGAVVTASQTLRAAVSQTFSIVNARVATARQAMRGDKDVTLQAFNLNGMNNGKLGLAGGNAMKGVGVWGQVQYTSVENDAAATAFDGFILTGMVGVDKSFMKNRVLAGLSAGYEMGDFDTTFNSGTVETSGFLVSPYVSFVPNDIISVDVTGGVGFGDVETTRKDSVTDDEFSGETEFMRWFGAFRVNADKQRNKMTYGASVGANYMTESRDAYAEAATGLADVDVGETSTRLGQAVVAARVGYDAGKVQPFGNAQFEYDFSKSKAAVVGADQTQPKESDYGLRLGAGLNINLKPGLMATISGDTVLLRDNYTEYGGRARLRFDF